MFLHVRGTVVAVPELPEVEIVACELARRCAGVTVRAAWGFPAPRYKSAAGCAGAVFGAAARIGKWITVPLSDGRSLNVHLGMTGRLCFDEQQHRHVRAWWDVGSGGVLCLVDPRRFGAAVVAPGPPRVGADALRNPLADLLTGRRSPIKAVLLDQAVVAGVGNYLADESLFAAGLHPARTQLTAHEAQVLDAAVKAQIAKSIANGGCTFKDYRHLDGTCGANQLSLSVYGRGGQRCVRCRSALAEMKLGGRNSVFCPRCQPSPTGTAQKSGGSVPVAFADHAPTHH